jgi:hypothetical protein
MRRTGTHRDELLGGHGTQSRFMNRAIGESAGNPSAGGHLYASGAHSDALPWGRFLR